MTFAHATIFATQHIRALLFHFAASPFLAFCRLVVSYLLLSFGVLFSLLLHFSFFCFCFVVPFTHTHTKKSYSIAANK